MLICSLKERVLHLELELQQGLGFGVFRHLAFEEFGIRVSHRPWYGGSFQGALQSRFFFTHRLTAHLRKEVDTEELGFGV